jgi:hypothetical protein
VLVYGQIYDCDFNQQLGFAIGERDMDHATSVFDVNHLKELKKYRIHNGNHCFGCTAGMGAVCKGSA